MTSIFSKFPNLETDRFKLREIVEDDAEALHQVYSDPDVVKYWGVLPFTKLDQTVSLIQDFQNGYRNESSIRWGIVKKDGNEVIGTCGYHAWAKKSYRAEMGYEIRKSEWRTGTMSEVLRKVIPFAHEQMQINRIGALIHPENLGSKELVSRFGFREEGLLKEYQCVDGEFRDLLLYSLLKTEYK